MPNITEKTTAMLIDELITTSMRCWFAQEDIMNENLSDKQRLDAAIRAQKQNAKRSELIKALDKLFGEEDRTVSTKTYYTYLDENR